MWRAHVKAARACARPRLRPRPPESARQSARVAMLTPPPRYLFFFLGLFMSGLLCRYRTSKAS